MDSYPIDGIATKRSQPVAPRSVCEGIRPGETVVLAVKDNTRQGTLRCGHASAHFAASTAGGVMRRVCQLHHHVERRERDLLANWLLETQVAN